MTLDEIKLFLKIDFDDDDLLIQSLIDTAIQYCQNVTGLYFRDDNPTYILLIKQLVAVWYDNRQSFVQGQVQEVPYTITNLLVHLSHVSEMKVKREFNPDTKRILT